MIKYIVTVMEEDHPLYEDYAYDVKRIDNGAYTGVGRFCRDAEEVGRYLQEEEQKRNKMLL